MLVHMRIIPMYKQFLRYMYSYCSKGGQGGDDALYCARYTWGWASCMVHDTSSCS